VKHKTSDTDWTQFHQLTQLAYWHLCNNSIWFNVIPAGCQGCSGLLRWQQRHWLCGRFGGTDKQKPYVNINMNAVRNSVFSAHRLHSAQPATNSNT